MAEQEKLAFTVELKPPLPPPPPTLIIRRNKDHRAPIVMPEDEAFDLYLALHEHFFGEVDDATEAEARGAGHDPAAVQDH